MVRAINRLAAGTICRNNLESDEATWSWIGFQALKINTHGYNIIGRITPPVQTATSLK